MSAASRIYCRSLLRNLKGVKQGHGSYHLPPIRQSSPHLLRGLCRIKPLGIKATANPVQKLFMLFVVRIGDGCQELLVSPGATHIFGWASPFALYTDRIPLS